MEIFFFFLLLLLLTSPAGTIVSNINHWIEMYGPWYPTIEPDMWDGRFWNREALNNANVVDNYAQMGPVLSKLNAGLPITVLAFGNSITAVLGGCFHDSEERRRKGVEAVRRPDQDNLCPAPGEFGWLTSFMRVINATWPHPGHLLMNLAVPGALSVMGGFCHMCPCPL
jgi:hypothetical protein